MNSGTDATGVEIFNQQRPALMGLAYRIVGSVNGAEDIVQEAFIRWSRCETQVENPSAWLSTVVTRLALDHCKSAEETRRRYFGPWLPEPLINEKANPESLHELDQTITMALLVVLDQLSPGERAAFILHDLFDFHFEDIASMLGKSSAACRQLASRGRSRLGSAAVVSTVSSTKHIEVAEAFFNATRTGDTESLVKLLGEAVIFHSDGGGKAAAARKILQGSTVVMEWILRAITPNLMKAGASLNHRIQWFNGAPGLLLLVEGKLVTAFQFVINEQGIQGIYALRNPDKLRLLLPSVE